MRPCTIIIPTLNEEGNISILLDRIEHVSETNNLSIEVVFVDDGSTDRTPELIQSYQGKLSVILITRENKRGLAGAIVCGARAATNENIVIMDADLSHPPESIPVLLDALEDDHTDIAIGSRYVAGAAIPQWPIHRRIASLLAALPARILTGTRDPLAGFFAVKKERLATLDDDLPGFKIGLELLLNSREECRVVEIPIVFQDRSNGSSKMGADVILAYGHQLLRLCGFILPTALQHKALRFGAIAILLDILLVRVFLAGGFSLATSYMVTFLFVLHSLFFLFFKSSDSLESGDPIRGYYFQTYMTALMLMSGALLLRGGLLASALRVFPVSHPIVLGIQALSIAGTWVFIVLALPRHSILRPSLRRSHFWLVAIICYSVFLRFVYLGAAELIQEEAYYWNYAQHLDFGYLDHPPIVALLIRIGTEIFGNSEFGVRIGSLLCWFGSAWFCWQYSHLLFNRRRALNTLFFLSVLPIFFGTGLLMTPDAPQVTCWAGSLYFLYRALVRGEKNAWLGAGVCLGLGLAAKYTIALLGPAIISYMVFEPRARKWFASPYPYLAASIALIIFSPVVLWNYEHGWASFLFQSQRRLTASTEFSLHELVGSILLLLTPIGCWALLCQFAPARMASLKQWWGDPESGSTSRFIIIMTALPLSVFIVFSLFKEVKLSWTGPIWLAALPLLSVESLKGILPIARRPERIGTTWSATAVFLLLFYGTCLHYFALGLPGTPFLRETFLLGWPNLALQLQNQSNTIEQETGAPPIIVGMDKYRVASGLAFYQTTATDQKDRREKLRILEETTGSHFFDRNSLMYSYWTAPSNYRNRTLLILSSDSDDLDRNRLLPYASSVGELQELNYEKFGQPIGPIYYRLLSGYKPSAHEVAQR